MMGSPRERLPLVPLLRAYADAGVPGLADLGCLPGPGPRFRAVLSATATFLDDRFLDGASDDTFGAALARFYEACVPIPLHAGRLVRRLRFVRHGLAHLMRCPDPLPQKLQRCLSADGPYFVPGLGASFWSAVVQGLRPHSYPGWTPAVVAGLIRLGLLPNPAHESPAVVYAAIQGAFTRLRAAAPALTALHAEHFLSLVAVMEGRDLFAGSARLVAGTPGVDLAATVKRVRSRQPLRELLKERGRELAEAHECLEEGLGSCDGKQIGRALAAADPEGACNSPIDWATQGELLTLWVSRLWEADDPYVVLDAFWADPVPGAGLWLPAAVLHLRDAQSYGPWSDGVRAGFALLDDSAEIGSVAERYRLFNEGLAWLRERYQLHPLETSAVLASLVPGPESADGGKRFLASPAAHRFGGFCADTFRFLRDLGQNNRRDWMEGQRERYQFAVRGPLVELCQALTERYVEPVLRRQHGWDLETDARNGLALTSVVKNDYGRSRPYNTTLWVTFCRREGGRRQPTQFFVRLDPDGLSYGLRLGASGRVARQQLRQRLLSCADSLYESLTARDTFAGCRLHGAALHPEGLQPHTADDFRIWLSGKDLAISRALPPDSPLLSGEDLVGDVLLTFDRLLPLYACAAGTAVPEPSSWTEPGRYTEADFIRDTHLGEDWLRRARGLLQLKRQLILQGVPGTGKTHVGRSLARLLAGGNPEALRLVQFHPAYSYEEFVEGIKVKSVEINGRHDVTYPVEEGLLCSFAARAALQPSQPHVLLVDEINRGNLPRIFGELLYLLEYRDQEVLLPYSRRSFCLPPNLYLLGTMNAADRSVALVDQALRRRFSFLEMPPDAVVLSAWLSAHPPAGGSSFAARVVGLFERLNVRLRTDLGPGYQVGHSYFMVPDLDDSRLRAVWQHQVRPLLEEYSLHHPGRAVVYELEDLLSGTRGGRRRPSTTGV
jgi:5-methylcytosine-specific restriction enzyme B